MKLIWLLVWSSLVSLSFSSITPSEEERKNLSVNILKGMLPIVTLEESTLENLDHERMIRALMMINAQSSSALSNDLSTSLHTIVRNFSFSNLIFHDFLDSVFAGQYFQKASTCF